MYAGNIVIMETGRSCTEARESQSCREMQRRLGKVSVKLASSGQLSIRSSSSVVQLSSAGICQNNIT